MLAPGALVARMPELTWLERHLEQTLRGRGQVCFVAGESGTGKTVLTSAFARHIQERQAELVVASGFCDAQTGVANPYLPFREVMNLLLGNLDERSLPGAVSEENARRLKKLVAVSVDVLVENGPDLIGILVPAATIVAKLGKTVVQKTELLTRLQARLETPSVRELLTQSGTDQSTIFEQCINVLQVLAQHKPLLLVLDDLHWADNASIDLLFRLGRRLEGSRICLVGTYRPEEIVGGREGARHPLEKVLAEFRRYYGDVVLDLNAVAAGRGREFVDTYLDSEPNRLDEAFRQALLRHTGGHPLFTVELLRHLVGRGDLVQGADGRWERRPDIAWQTLPARIEGVVAERVARLDASTRRQLTVASVEGEEFTAEVVARVESVPARELVFQLSGPLQDEYQLVTGQGVRRVGGQRLSTYRFAHSLMQAYFYGSLDAIERSYLHEDVGLALETLYGDQAGDIAVQLARHFELADLPARALTYLRQAAEQAVAAYANAEALAYLDRALALAAAPAARYEILLLREHIHDLLGERAAQAEDLAALATLAAAWDDAAWQAEVALRQGRLAVHTADYAAALDAARAGVETARTAGAAGLEAAGHHLWGTTLRQMGRFAEAATRYGQARERAEAAADPQLLARVTRSLGGLHYLQGEHGAARATLDQALATYRELGDRHGETLCLEDLGIVAAALGEYAASRAYAERALRRHREMGDRKGENRCLNALATAFSHEGDYAAAEAAYRESLALARELEDRTLEALALNNLADGAWTIGDYAAAEANLRQALAIQQAIGDRHWETLCLINLGVIASDQGHYEEADAFLRQALANARELAATDTEGVILCELGILAGRQEQPELARDHFAAALERHEAAEALVHALEDRAGLAEASLAIGDLDEARAHLAVVLTHLERDPEVTGAERPFRVYRLAYAVLRATGDDRAGPLLAQACARLEARAARLPDAAIRASYLQNVSDHRELLAARAADP